MNYEFPVFSSSCTHIDKVNNSNKRSVSLTNIKTGNIEQLNGSKRYFLSNTDASNVITYDFIKCSFYANIYPSNIEKECSINNHIAVMTQKSVCHASHSLPTKILDNSISSEFLQSWKTLSGQNKRALFLQQKENMTHKSKSADTLNFQENEQNNSDNIKETISDLCLSDTKEKPLTIFPDSINGLQNQIKIIGEKNLTCHSLTSPMNHVSDKFNNLSEQDVLMNCIVNIPIAYDEESLIESETSENAKLSTENLKDINGAQENAKLSTGNLKDINGAPENGKLSTENLKDINGASENGKLSTENLKDINEAPENAKLSIGDLKDINGAAKNAKLSTGNLKDINGASENGKLSTGNLKDMNGAPENAKLSTGNLKDINGDSENGKLLIENFKDINRVPENAKLLIESAREMNRVDIKNNRADHISDDEVHIEQVSDEEDLKYNTVDSIDLELPNNISKSIKRKNKKTPDFNLDDSLVKGFEAALGKLSKNENDKYSPEISSNCEAVNAETSRRNSTNDLDDPITRRALERLDHKLQEAYKLNSVKWSPCRELPSYGRTSKESLSGRTTPTVQMRKCVMQRTRRPSSDKDMQSDIIDNIAVDIIDEKPPKNITNRHTLNITTNEYGDESVNTNNSSIVENDLNTITDNLSIFVKNKSNHITINSANNQNSMPIETNDKNNILISSVSNGYLPNLTDCRADGTKGNLSNIKSVNINVSNDDKSARPAPNKEVYIATLITPITRRKQRTESKEDQPLDLRYDKNVHSINNRSNGFSDTASAFSAISPVNYTPSQCNNLTNNSYIDTKFYRSFPEVSNQGNFPNSWLASATQPIDRISRDTFTFRAQNNSPTVTSRRPLHTREKLSVYTDTPNSPMSRMTPSPFNYQSCKIDSQGDLDNTYKNYVESRLEDKSDVYDPIARKALERFDSYTGNSTKNMFSLPRVSSSPHSYGKMEDDVLRSAVMRMEDKSSNSQFPDYRSSLGQSDIDNFSPVLQSNEYCHENSNSPELANNIRLSSNSTGFREGSMSKHNLVNNFENRSVQGLRHIFNYLENQDYKINHTQSSLRQTPTKQHFSYSREYTRPKPMSIHGTSNSFGFKSLARPNNESSFLPFTNRLPPKSERFTVYPKEGFQGQSPYPDYQNDDQSNLRGSLSHSNLFVPDLNAFTAFNYADSNKSGRSTPTVSRQIDDRKEDYSSKHDVKEKYNGFDRSKSLERSSLYGNIGIHNRNKLENRISPAPTRRGLSISTGSSPSNARVNQSNTVDNENKRKNEHLKNGASRMYTTHRSRGPTPKLSVSSSYKASAESDRSNSDKPISSMHQMSVFERLYRNNKR